ncbi:MAG TPA: UDP-4-amino-4,6-dideoxy-N-acetyl-beta-L-altrosamine transaminase [Gammaproteobacteria bacterium]|nr:UDP-4-amino-4,6-dideoxy-N-acetyl-beta-L-altrosamine transaminase [Gammaproteobacteria bacterium]
MSDRPPLSYGSQWIDDDDVEAVVRVLRSDWLTTGPTVEAFERALIEVTACHHAVAVNSGTAALHVAYAAASVGADDEVITSPLTFVATASAALVLGAKIRFADVEPDTGNIDPRMVAELANERTRVIAAVDYAGHPADYDALAALPAAGARTLVADAAHSLGATFRGRAVGTLADITTLSFHPVKAITTGEGGAVLTSRASFAESARRFRNHGIVRASGLVPAWSYEVPAVGLNYRIPDILCALGISQLRKLGAFLERRRTIAARYGEAFADLGNVTIPAERPDALSAWHLYVLRVRDAARRDALFDALRAAGLLVQVHYIPVYWHPMFAALGYRRGLCPHAETFAASALSLPLYPRMDDDDVDRVIGTVRRCVAATL